MNNKIVVGINLGDYGSTGSIMRNCLEYAHENGDYDYLVIVPHSRGKSNTFGFKDKPVSFAYNLFVFRILKIHYWKADGFFDSLHTKRIIRKIKGLKKKYNSIIIHLHNIHHAYIDFRLLFRFFSKNKNIKIFYTLHDKWILTGGCYCCSYCKCNEWKKECSKVLRCPQGFDSKRPGLHKNYLIKKKYLSLVKDQITLIPVSYWLARDLQSTYLKSFKTIVIHGECSIFPCTNIDFELRNKLKIKENDNVVISISPHWSKEKGSEFVIPLSKLLPDGFKLIIIGCGGPFERDNIIHIESVENNLLPNYFSISDCFASLTQEDNLPLVLMESQICGVPVVGFGHGGTPEEINEQSGIMVGTDNDIYKLAKTIIDVVLNKRFSRENIMHNGNRFRKYEHAKKVYELYEKV